MAEMMHGPGIKKGRKRILIEHVVRMKVPHSDERVSCYTHYTNSITVDIVESRFMATEGLDTTTTENKG